MNKSILIFSISFFFSLYSLMCQDKLVKACKELKKVSFFENYDYKKIQKTTKEFYLILLQSPKESYNKCNCADTLWLALLNDPRPLTSCTHCELGENRGDYLRYLVLLIDEYNLEVEFSIQCLPTLLDSFNYVIQRVEIKNIKRETSKDSWRTFYHCIEAETNFLKEKSQFLFKTYLKYFDDTTNNEYNRDLMLCSLFDSKQFIEEEIIKRMSKEDNYKFFYRMLGILTTSGSNKSIKYLSNHLKTHKLELKETELILRAIYEIKSNKRIDEPIWTSFKNFLKDSKLDSLVKANYFEELYLNNDRK